MGIILLFILISNKYFYAKDKKSMQNTLRKKMKQKFRPHSLKNTEEKYRRKIDEKYMESFHTELNKEEILIIIFK